MSKRWNFTHTRSSGMLKDSLSGSSSSSSSSLTADPSRHRHDLYSKARKAGEGGKVKNGENSRLSFVDGAGLYTLRYSFLYAYYGRGVRNIYGLFTLEASCSYNISWLSAAKIQKNVREYNKIKGISCRHFYTVRKTLMFSPNWHTWKCRHIFYEVII